MQQQSSQMFYGDPPSVPISNITTEEIQKCLEENKQLIQAIMEYNRIGKFEECAPHRAQLQRNLTFLSGLADVMQPAAAAAAAVPTEMLPHSVAQQGQCLQHPEAAVPQRQGEASSFSGMNSRLNGDWQQSSCLIPQQFIQVQMGIKPPIAATDINAATIPNGAGSGSNMLNVMGNNQVGLGPRNAGNFLGKPFSGYSGGETEY